MRQWQLTLNVNEIQRVVAMKGGKTFGNLKWTSTKFNSSQLWSDSTEEASVASNWCSWLLYNGSQENTIHDFGSYQIHHADSGLGWTQIQPMVKAKSSVLTLARAYPICRR